MRRIGLVLAGLALAAPVFAGGIEVASRGVQLVPRTGLPRADVTVYSNTTNTTGCGYTTTSGATADTVGDDLIMTSGGRLNTVAFSIWNCDLTQHLTHVDLELSFYNGRQDPSGDWVYELAGRFSYNDYPLNAEKGLDPGYASFEGFTNVASENINLTQRVAAMLRITDLQGGSTSAGQLVFDPPTIGASQSYFWKNDVYGYSFGGPPNPPGNFVWEIGVPEPASMLLVGLAGLLIRRR